MMGIITRIYSNSKRIYWQFPCQNMSDWRSLGTEDYTARNKDFIVSLMARIKPRQKPSSIPMQRLKPISAILPLCSSLARRGIAPILHQGQSQSQLRRRLRHHKASMSKEGLNKSKNLLKRDCVIASVQRSNSAFSKA